MIFYCQNYAESVIYCHALATRGHILAGFASAYRGLAYFLGW